MAKAGSVEIKIVMLWKKPNVEVLKCTEASGVVMTFSSLGLGF